jgi:hypothetical protein
MKAELTPAIMMRDRWLMLVRGACLAMAVLAIVIYLLNIPAQWAHFHRVCSGAACPVGQLSPNSLRELQRSGLSVDFYATYLTATNAAFVLVFVILAAILFRRKSNDWIGIYVSLTLVLFGITFFSDTHTPLAEQYSALLLPRQLLSVLGGVCFGGFFYLFPDGHFAPRWMFWLLPVVLIREALAIFWPQLPGVAWLFYIEVGSALFAQVYRYWRVSNASQRQQTKWVVFGSVIGVGGFIGVLVLLVAVLPGNGSSGLGYLMGVTAIYLFVAMIPVSIAIAILRSHLWDIDLLIRRTLVYGLLTALLAFVYLGVVIALQTIFNALTGSARSELVTVLSTLVIAALFVPLRHRVQALIDRRFYRRKYDAARTLAAFSNSIRDEVELGRLAEHLTEVVEETLQPETVTLWLKGQPAPLSAGRPR